jgi:GxxExxY protein
MSDQISVGRREAAQDPLTYKIIGCAIEVHRELGPGLLESAYETCLAWELEQAGLGVERQVLLPVRYKQLQLNLGYRMDLVVGRRVVIENKTVESISPLHEAQLLTYLKLSGLPTGLIINFNSPVLHDGIRRLVL